MTAKRVGQCVDRSDRRVGEGLAGEQGAEQHGLAGFAVAAVLHHRIQVAGQQAQGLAGEHVGQRVLLQFAGVGLDGVHHGVDAGGGGDVGGQPEGQVGIQQRQIRQQNR